MQSIHTVGHLALRGTLGAPIILAGGSRPAVHLKPRSSRVEKRRRRTEAGQRGPGKVISSYGAFAVHVGSRTWPSSSTRRTSAILPDDSEKNVVCSRGLRPGRDAAARR